MIAQSVPIDEEELESSKEIEIRTMKNLLTHKINSLKNSSQNAHSSYIVLLGAGY